jgi:hypothetical protein
MVYWIPAGLSSQIHPSHGRYEVATRGVSDLRPTRCAARFLKYPLLVLVVAILLFELALCKRTCARAARAHGRADFILRLLVKVRVR